MFFPEEVGGEDYIEGYGQKAKDELAGILLSNKIRQEKECL